MGRFMITIPGENVRIFNDHINSVELFSYAGVGKAVINYGTDGSAKIFDANDNSDRDANFVDAIASALVAVGNVYTENNVDDTEATVRACELFEKACTSRGCGVSYDEDKELLTITYPGSNCSFDISTECFSNEIYIR